MPARGPELVTFFPRHVAYRRSWSMDLCKDMLHLFGREGKATGPAGKKRDK